MKNKKKREWRKIHLIGRWREELEILACWQGIAVCTAKWKGSIVLAGGGFTFDVTYGTNWFYGRPKLEQFNVLLFSDSHSGNRTRLWAWWWLYHYSLSSYGALRKRFYAGVSHTSGKEEPPWGLFWLGMPSKGDKERSLS